MAKKTQCFVPIRSQISPQMLVLQLAEKLMASGNGESQGT